MTEIQTGTRRVRNQRGKKLQITRFTQCQEKPTQMGNSKIPNPGERVNTYKKNTEWTTVSRPCLPLIVLPTLVVISEMKRCLFYPCKCF